tara:strand:+ start:3734 stop:4282 length:549 start_codon:yes stop_codon:yes gene_type:complete
MSDKKKKVVTTPIGEAKWFSVSKVDKFGNYTVELHLDESERSMKFVDFLENFAEGKKPIEKTESGYKVKLKAKSQGTKRDNSTYAINPPAIYSSAGTRISGAELEKLNIGNGSKIRAKIEVKEYEFMGSKGVSIGLKSVQIVEAVEYSGGGQDLGFDALEMPNVESDEQKESFEETSGNYDF